MTVQQLRNKLETVDGSKTVHLETLTEFGWDDGSRNGKTLGIDVFEEKNHPDEVMFRVMYKHQ